MAEGFSFEEALAPASAPPQPTGGFSFEEALAPPARPAETRAHYVDDRGIPTDVILPDVKPAPDQMPRGNVGDGRGYQAGWDWRMQNRQPDQPDQPATSDAAARAIAAPRAERAAFPTSPAAAASDIEQQTPSDFVPDVTPRGAPVVRVPGQGLTGASINNLTATAETGIGQSVAAFPRMVQGVAGAARAAPAKQLAVMDRIDAGLPVRPEDYPPGYGGMSPDERQAARANLTNYSQAQQQPGPIETGAGEMADRISTKFANDAARLNPVDTENAKKTVVKIAGLVGGFAPMMAEALVGGMPAMVAGGFAQGFENRMEDALARHVPVDQAFYAAVLNGGVQAGLLAFPAAQYLGRMPPKIGNAVASYAMRVAMNGGTMLGVGQASAIADNLTARLYDPTRPLGQGVGEDMAEQVLVGMLLPMMHQAPGAIGDATRAVGRAMQPMDPALRANLEAQRAAAAQANARQPAGQQPPAAPTAPTPPPPTPPAPPPPTPPAPTVDPRATLQAIATTGKGPQGEQQGPPPPPQGPPPPPMGPPIAPMGPPPPPPGEAPPTPTVTPAPTPTPAPRKAAIVTPYERVPKEPQRLVNFLRQPWTDSAGTHPGGVRDDGGDIKALIGGYRGRPGLINNKAGDNLDNATLRAWQAGYLPEFSDRPMINDLLDKIDRDHNMEPVYSAYEQDAATAYSESIARNDEINELASRHGIDIAGRTRDQFFDDLADKLSLDDLADEIRSQDEAVQGERTDAERAARLEAEQQRGAPVTPAELYGQSQTRTLKDLENENEQIGASPDGFQRAQDVTRSGRIPGGEEQVPEASGPLGSADRPGRGVEAEGGEGGPEPPGGLNAPRLPGIGGDLFGGQERAPTVRREAEPTIRNDQRQDTLPGTEASAIQAQAQSDQAGGTGRLQPKVDQKPTNQGLFARPETVQPELPAATPIQQGVRTARNRWKENGFRDLLYNIFHPNGVSGHAVARDWVRQMGRETGNEHLAIVDKDGNIIHAGTSAMPKTVQFDARQHLAGVEPDSLVLHHNHPSGWSFSPEDVRMLMHSAFSHIVAHSTDGSNTYTVAMGDAGRVARDSLTLDARGLLLRGTYKLADAEARKIVIPLYESGQLSLDQANFVFHDVVNRILSGSALTRYSTTARLPDVVAKGLADYFVSRGQSDDVHGRFAYPVRADLRASGLPEGVGQPSGGEAQPRPATVAPTGPGNTSRPVQGRLFDPAGTLADPERERPIPLYSAVSRAVDGLKQARGTGEQLFAKRKKGQEPTAQLPLTEQAAAKTDKSAPPAPAAPTASAPSAASAPAATELTPAAQAARGTLRQAATAMMRFMGLPEQVGLNFVQNLDHEGGADAMYQHQLITYALDTAASEAPVKIWHEAVHALRDKALGLLTDAQNRALDVAADRALNNGRQGVELRKELTDAGTPKEQWRDEAIAIMAENALRTGEQGRSVVGAVAHLMQNFARGVGQMLRGQGYLTADDVFNGIMGGDRALPGSRDAMIDAYRGSFAAPAAPAAAPTGAAAPKPQDYTVAGTTITLPDKYFSRRTPAALQRAAQTSAVARAAIRVDDYREKIGDNLSHLISPMTGGSKQAMAYAFRFASALRSIQFQYGQIDKMITTRFNPAAREAMGRAMDDQSVLEQQILTMRQANVVPQGAATVPMSPAQMTANEAQMRAALTAQGKGVDSLPADQRQVVQDLAVISEQVWDRMRQRGLVQPGAEGLPYYFARQIIMRDPDNVLTSTGMKGRGRDIQEIGGNLNTQGPMSREHLTPEETEAAAKLKLGQGAELVRDIRSLVQRLASNERSIAGTDLIDQIERVGQAAGVNLVIRGDIPGMLSPGDYFTVNHPSLQKYVGAGFQSLHIVREFEGPLNAVLTTKTGDFYKSLMKVKGGVMHAIMFSPFMHLAVELGRALPLMPGKIISGQVNLSGSRLRQNPTYMNTAIMHGLSPIGQGWSLDPVKVAEEADVSGRNRFVEMVARARDAVAGAAGRAVGTVLPQGAADWTEAAVKHPSQTLLWDQVFNLQVGIYSEMANRFQAKGFAPDVAGVMAAHIANRYAGALPPENLSKLMNQSANMLLFSRSFTLGNLGVMKDMLNGAPQHVRAAIEQMAGPAVVSQAQSAMKRKAQSAFIWDIGLQVLGTAVMQQMFQIGTRVGLMGLPAAAQSVWDDWLADTKQSLSKVGENPLNLLGVLPQYHNEPGKKNRAFYGVDSKGQGIYVRPAFGKVGEEFTGWFTHPGDMILNKLSPFARPILELAIGEDTLGRLIIKPDPKTVGDYMHNAGAIATHFLSAQGPWQAIGGAYQAVTGQQKGDRGVAAAKAIVPMTGLGLVSSGYPGGPEAGEVASAKKSLKFDVQQIMPTAAQKAQSGDVEGAIDLLLKAGEDPKAARTITRYLANPSVGQASAARWKARHPNLIGP